MNEQTIFTAAIELGPQERPAFLDQACCADKLLRQRVEKLLGLYENVGNFLERPAAGAVLTEDQPVTERPGTQIGPYKLLEQIGEGGMGVVYVAEQKVPVRRKVALKVIKPGMDTRQVVARFEAERQALAMMNHPNIAKVLDAGATEAGRPYFIMELVKGTPITEFCDQLKYDTRQRLRLFSIVCQAVQHAHQKGLIHRDIKPSNILVEMHDVTPVPKVIDFGVAKAIGQQLTERTLHTGFRQMVGTPLYMSPEQAGQSSIDIDTRSDVYSLGVLLYELLTGHTPFESETLRSAGEDEMRRIIREVDPPRPSARVSTLEAKALSTVSDSRQADPRKLSQQLRGELDWIVMKSLEKDRSRRYNSAVDLSDDIGRYLVDQSVYACPPTLAYQMSKFARRYRKSLAMAATILLTLLFATGLSVRYALIADSALFQSKRQQVISEQRRIQAEEFEQQAILERNQVRRNLYVAGIRLAGLDLLNGNIARLHQTLNSQIPRDNEPDYRGWEWYYLLGASHSETMTLDGSGFNEVAWSPDGSKIAAVGKDKFLRIWNADGESLLKLDVSTGWNACCAWSPDSRRIAWGIQANKKGGAQILDLKTREIRNLFWDVDPNSRVFSLAWSPDGKRLATGSISNEFRIWDVETETEIHKLDSKLGQIWGMSWTSDGNHLAIAGTGKNGVQVWNTNSGISESEFAIDGFFRSVAYSSDDKFLIAVDTRGICYVWQTVDGSLYRKFDAHQGEVKDVAAHPHEPLICTCGDDCVIRVWNILNGKNTATLVGHETIVNSVAWDPSGNRIVSGSEDSTVRVWTIAKSNPSYPRTFDTDKITDFEPHDGSFDFSARLDDASTQALSAEIDDLKKLREILNPGEMPTDDARVRRYIDLASIGLAPRPHHLSRLYGPDKSTLQVAVAWSKNFSSLLTVRKTSSGSFVFQLWYTDKEAPTTLANAAEYFFDASWSDDGERLAIASMQQWEIPRLNIFDGRTGDNQSSAIYHASAISAISWNHAGTRIVTGSRVGEVAMWDAKSGRPLTSKPNIVHRHGVKNLSFSPDDNRIATLSFLNEIAIIDADSQNGLVNLNEKREALQSLRWSTNGLTLFGLSADGSIEIWDATRGQQYLESRRLHEDQERSDAMQKKRNVADLKSRFQIQFSKKQFDEAAATISELIEDDPNNPELLRLHAHVLLKLHQYEAALRDLARATEIDPRNWVFWNNRGVAEQRLEKFDDAVNSYLQAVALSPDTIAQISRFNLGGVYEQLDRPLEALAIYQFIYRKYNSMNAAASMIGIYEDAGKSSEAALLRREMLDRVDQLEDKKEKRYVIWQHHGPGHSMDDLDRAMNVAIELNRLPKEFPESKRWIGYLQYRMGKYEDALATMESSSEPIGNDPSIYCWYFLAMTHAQLGHRADAERWLKRANEEFEHELSVDGNGYRKRKILEFFRKEATDTVYKSNEQWEGRSRANRAIYLESKGDGKKF